MNASPTWQTRPVTPERFEDFADVINPNRRATHCWCLSHRLRSKDIEALGQGDRERAMRAMCDRDGASSASSCAVDTEGLG